MTRATTRLVVFGAWAALQVGAAGCFYDYGALSGTRPDTGPGLTGTGGGTDSSGGAPGTGGSANTGGRAATGGAPAGTGGAGSGGASTGNGGRGSDKRVDTDGQTGGGGAGSGGAGGGKGGAAVSTGGAGGAGGGMGGASLGMGGARAGTGGAAGATAGQVAPVLWYRFDDTSGDATDSGSGPGAPRNGILMTFGSGGAVAFSPTKIVGTGAVAFAGNQATGGGYVVIPSLFDLAPSAVTLSVWVYPTVDHDWTRIFDFGSSQTINMFLTNSEGQDANNYVRFAITKNGTTAEQRITSNVALGLNRWHHLAVVLNAGSPYTGQLYVNGALAGTNTAMTLHAADLGATTGNYLGRSTFPADWFYSGSIDDFRVYNRALSAAEVTAVFNER